MTAARYRLNLRGPFGLWKPEGARVEIASRKGVALIALLAMAPDGERTRPWLQDMLWGSRAHKQGGASLRRELSSLRAALNGTETLLRTEHGRVALAVDRIDVDVRSGRGDGEFLEGIDLFDAEGFEQWLREERLTLAAEAVAPPVALPRDIVDLTSPAIDAPDRPVVAVLPFGNLTGDPRLDHVAEGLAADLIDQLARLRWLPVIAGAASFAYPSHAHSAAEIGRALGARYLVDGRLRTEPDARLLALMLSDAQTGEAIWSHRVLLPAVASATAVGPILDALVGALATRIEQVEMIRAARSPTVDPDVTNLIWRARWHHNRYTPEHAKIAGELLERALALDPTSPEALIQLAYFRQRQVWIGRAGEAEIADLASLARRAMDADPIDGRGYMIAGIAELWRRETANAVTLLEEAVRLNPSLAYAYTQLAAAHYLAGQPERALEPIGHAFRLGLGEQYNYYALGELAMVRAMLGDRDGAVAAADHAIVRREAYWFAHVAKIFALAEDGRRDEAASAWTRLRRAKPRFAAHYLDWVPFTGEAWPARIKRSLAYAQDCAA
jgi:TolB-like protein